MRAGSPARCSGAQALELPPVLAGADDEEGDLAELVACSTKSGSVNETSSPSSTRTSVTRCVACAASCSNGS